MRIRKIVETGAQIPIPFYYTDNIGVWVVSDDEFSSSKEVPRAVAPNQLKPSESGTGLTDTFRHFGYGILKLSPANYQRRQVVEYKVIERRGTKIVVDYNLENHPLLRAFLKQRIAEGSDRGVFEVWQNEFLWVHETPWLKQDSFKSKYDGATHTIGF